MKRLYIAIILILISVGAGIYEMITIQNTMNYTVKKLNENLSYVDNNQINKARKQAKQLSKNFESKSINTLFLYYDHTKLTEINKDLASIDNLLKYKQKGNYYETVAEILQGLNVINKEQNISIQNIL